MPSVKADLAIYSHTVDVGGQYMSESLTLVLVILWSVFANPVTYVVKQLKPEQLKEPMY